MRFTCRTEDSTIWSSFNPSVTIFLFAIPCAWQKRFMLFTLKPLWFGNSVWRIFETSFSVWFCTSSRTASTLKISANAAILNEYKTTHEAIIWFGKWTIQRINMRVKTQFLLFLTNKNWNAKVKNFIFIFQNAKKLKDLSSFFVQRKMKNKT